MKVNGDHYHSIWYDKNLDKVKSCMKLTGYVNSSENFIQQPQVINGASDLISSVFK